MFWNGSTFLFVFKMLIQSEDAANTKGGLMQDDDFKIFTGAVF